MDSKILLKNENNIGTIFDELKEKLNIATGIAASKMGDFLNLFITMPVPNIKIEKGISLFNTIQEWLNIDENITHAFVVPLSLQLLLENAIKHNYATSPKPLNIKIFSYICIEIVMY